MLAMRLTQQNFSEALMYLIPIAAFYFGVLLTDLLRDKCGNRFFHWRQPVLLLEIALLILVGLLPQTSWGNPTATTLISFLRFAGGVLPQNRRFGVRYDHVYRQFAQRDIAPSLAAFAP